MATPVSLVQALVKKYSEENCVLDDLAHIYFPFSQQKAEGQASLIKKRYKVVVLDHCDISLAGKAGEIESVCPSITELDLTGNCIISWTEVMNIVVQLRNLQLLNLCGNPLDDSTYFPTASRSLTSLTQLVLNNTNVSLDTIKYLVQSFPSLVELYICLNNYSTVPEANTPCTTVRRLHFNGNHIKTWKDVENLGKMFPNLETLVMMENPLSNVLRDDEQKSFRSLKFLSLTKTNLSSWEDIDNLRKFACLDSVKLLGVSLLYNYNEEDARKLVLARLPNIKILNGTPVTIAERQNAERHFLRTYQTSEKPSSRYFELVTIHGAVEPLAHVDMDTFAKYVNVLMHVTGQAPRLEKVNVETTTLRFKKDLACVLNVPVDDISLYYEDKACNQGSERMLYKSRPLYRYGIKEGDCIYVDIATKNN